MPLSGHTENILKRMSVLDYIKRGDNCEERDQNAAAGQNGWAE